MHNCNGNVHAIERFGTFDGPGLRYVLFLQGCPFQCQYCHNRDSWSTRPHTLMSVSDVFADFESHQAFYAHGGLTVSGGEPLLQLDFVHALFDEAKKRNIHTTLDTSAACYGKHKESQARALLALTDLVLLDIKAVDEAAHQSLTGANNRGIKAFLELCEALKKQVIIRHVLIPTLNDDQHSITEFEDYVTRFRCVEKIEVLPYHSHGAHKWEALGESYPLTGLPDMDKDVAKNVELRLNNTLKQRMQKKSSEILLSLLKD